MPNYKFRDLMVSLETKGVNDTRCLHYTGCHNYTPINCYNFSCGISLHCLNGCSGLPSLCIANTCPGGSVLCRFGTCGITEPTTWWETTTPIQQFIPSMDVQELAELKVALQGLVEKIDKEFKPEKLEQLDVLESKMSEAINDIKEQKKKFS
jgi:hypothetical protein